MRFRIVINDNTGEWEIQIAKFQGLLWKALPQKFNSFYEAEIWVLDQGLDEAYYYQDARKMERLISGDQVWIQQPDTGRSLSRHGVPSVVQMPPESTRLHGG